MNTETAKNRLPGLDGLRGLAVLMVLWAHAGNREMNPIKDLIDIDGSSIGIHGVFIFFVLSAFLLTRQFLTNDFSAFPLVSFLNKYVYRRVARIFPLYVLALCAYYCAGLVVGFDLYVDSFESLLQALVLYKGPGFFWTIPVEFTYYLILPFVAAFFICARNRVFVLNGITFAVLLLITIAIPPGYEGLISFIGVFLLGSYAAYLGISFRKSKMVQVVLEIFGVVALLGIFCFIPDVAEKVFGLTVDLPEKTDLHMTIGALSTIVVLGITNGSGTVLSRLFSSRILRFWGQISFSAYLGHMAILDIVGHVFPHSVNVWIKFAVFILLTAILGWVSYWLFEMKIYGSKRLKKAWDNLFNVSHLR